MDENFRTADSVLEWLEKKVRAKEIIDAHTWVECCQYLNILSSEPQERLFELQQLVAQQKVSYMENGDSAAMAKIKVEASDEHKDMCRQKAKLERMI